MKENVEDFIEEFSNNFSELFVETFVIKFLFEYDKKDLFDAFKLTKELMNKKINKKMLTKMEK